MLWGGERKPLYGYYGNFKTTVHRMCLLILCIFQFSILLLIVLTMELAAGIAGYIRRGEVETMLKSTLNSTMYDYYKKPDIRSTWDIVQHEVSKMCLCA